MIDTKELRRGNIICASEDENGNNEPCRVFEIYEDGVRWGLLHDDHGGNSTSYKYLAPIPLSPYWLNRLGFSYDITGEDEDKIEYWDKSTPYHKHSFGPFTFTIVKWNDGDFTFSHHSIRKDCKHLHDLQNIWFYTTGEELTIKQ